MTDSQSLDGMRHILMVKNKPTPYSTTGPLTPGTEVFCLRTNDFGVYCPCVARIVKATSKRITVDLWSDLSERVTVSHKAILWRQEVSA